MLTHKKTSKPRLLRKFTSSVKLMRATTVMKVMKISIKESIRTRRATTQKIVIKLRSFLIR